MLESTNLDGLDHHLFQYVPAHYRSLHAALMLMIVVGYSAFLDIALAAIPVSVIWALQMPMHKKINLSLIMGVGIL